MKSLRLAILFLHALDVIICLICNAHEHGEQCAQHHRPYHSCYMYLKSRSLLPVMTAFQLDNMLWQMQDSPMQQLLDDAQREVVADVVNAALLASASGKPKWEVKPQVSRLFCMINLSLCSFMITSCQTLQQFLVSLLMRIPQCSEWLPCKAIFWQMIHPCFLTYFSVHELTQSRPKAR